MIEEQAVGSIKNNSIKHNMDSYDYCQMARRVIDLEAKAVAQLTSRIDNDFARACAHMHNCNGRIIVIGMGKSGHIASKIAATLSSTGSPAFFVHPAEASHGDMGMITVNDVVLALSNSGNTTEIMAILPLIQRLQVPLITLTGNPRSELATAATVNIDVSVNEEACPLGLAPTTSTTVALVMGDAMAVALLEAKNFTAEDFALSHPGGRLGRRLLLKVADLMHQGTDMPMVQQQQILAEALLEITRKKLGMTTVVDEQGILLGVFTDGDLRRVLDEKLDITSTAVADIMNRTPKIIAAEQLAVEALSVMESLKITTLVVVDELQHPQGVLHMHDILTAGVI